MEHPEDLNINLPEDEQSSSGRPESFWKNSENWKRMAVYLALALCSFFWSCQVSSGMVEARLKPLGQGLLSKLSPVKFQVDKLPIRVIDISPLYNFKGDNHALSASDIEKLVNQLLSLEPKPSVIAFDVNLGFRPSTGFGRAAEMAIGGDAGMSIGSRYAEHKPTLEYLAKVDEDPDLEIFVGTSQHDAGPENAFFVDWKDDKDLAHLANKCAPMAGAIALRRNPRVAPKYFQGKAPGAKPVLSFGHKIASALYPNSALTSLPSIQSMVGATTDRKNDTDGLVITEDVSLDYTFLRSWDKMVFSSILDAVPAKEGKPPVTYLILDENSFDRLGKEVGEMHDESLKAGGTGYALVLGRAISSVYDDAVAVDDWDDSWFGSESEIYPRLVQHVAYVNSFLFRPLTEAPDLLSKALEVLGAVFTFVLGLLAKKKLRGTNEAAADRVVRIVCSFGFGLILFCLCLGLNSALGDRTVFVASVAGLAGIVLSMVGSSRFKWWLKLPSVQSEVLIRCGSIAFTLIAAIFLASFARLYWIGFVTVVIFVLIEGFFEPIVEVFVERGLGEKDA